MLIEKHPIVTGFASPRVLFVGLGAGVLLVGAGAAIYQTRSNFVAGTQTPTPSAVAGASTAPTVSPTLAPTETPSPTPTPTETPVSVTDARAAYAAKDYPKAITLYVGAVKQAQGAVAISQLQYELANSYRDNKDNDLALSTYSLAIAQNPKLVVAYQARANLLIALGRKDEASTTLQAGVDANPGNQDLERDLSVLQLNGPTD